MAKNKKVRMVGRISGTRDGKDWPAPGESITLAEDEAQSLIASGMAVEPDVETATTTTPVETATTGNKSVRLTAAQAKAAADKQAAEKAEADKARAEAEARELADAAKKSEDQAKKSEDGK